MSPTSPRTCPTWCSRPISTWRRALHGSWLRWVRGPSRRHGSAPSARAVPAPAASPKSWSSLRREGLGLAATELVGLLRLEEAAKLGAKFGCVLVPVNGARVGGRGVDDLLLLADDGQGAIALARPAPAVSHLAGHES